MKIEIPQYVKDRQVNDRLVGKFVNTEWGKGRVVWAYELYNSRIYGVKITHPIEKFPDSYKKCNYLLRFVKKEIEVIADPDQLTLL